MRLIGTHGSPINCLHVSGDGRYALVSSSDGGLVRWSMCDGRKTLLVADWTEPLFALSPDGDWLVADVDGVIVKIDIESGVRTELTKASTAFDRVGYTAISVSACGQHVAIAGGSGHVEARTIDGELVWAAKTDGWPYAVYFTPNGRIVVTASGCMLHVGELTGFDGDASNTKWALETLVPIGPFFDVVAYHDELVVLAGIDDNDDRGLIVAWNIDTNECVAIQDRPSGVHAIALAPDGQRVITGGNDQSLDAWTLPTLEAAGSFSLGTAERGSASGSDFPYPPYYVTSGPAAVRCVAAHPNGETVLCGLEDGMIVEVSYSELTDHQGVVDLFALRKWIDGNQVQIDRLAAFEATFRRGESDALSALEDLLDTAPEFGLRVLEELKRQARRNQTNP